MRHKLRSIFSCGREVLFPQLNVPWRLAIKMASSSEIGAALAIWVVLTITGLLVLFRTNLRWWLQKARESQELVTSTVLRSTVDLNSLNNVINLEPPSQLRHVASVVQLETSVQHVRSTYLPARDAIKELKTFEKQRLSADVFTSHKRTEANFVRGPADAKVGFPPKYPPEKALHPRSETALYYSALPTPNSAPAHRTIAFTSPCR